MRARHVLTILAVADVDRASSFYKAAFGFTERVRVPVYVELEIDGGRGLGLYVRDGFARNTTAATPIAITPGATSATELYFHCDDLSEAIAQVEKAGGRLLSARKLRDWGDEAAYFADPDDNVVVVATPVRPA